MPEHNMSAHVLRTLAGNDARCLANCKHVSRVSPQPAYCHCCAIRHYGAGHHEIRNSQVTCDGGPIRHEA